MTKLIQEYFDSRDVTLKIDREAGVLRGVKLIGLESRNGRRYRESALQAATQLYEGAKVNVNHPKDGPLTPRDYQDRIGVIRDVQPRQGEGLFGDLHFNPKHTLAEQLLWDAEHNPQNVGFSHNVLARLTTEEGTTIVEEITKVQSVDLVADPAATQGLFEQSTLTNQTASPEKPSWDALTLEVLKQHRPDLLAEFQVFQTAQMQEQFEAAQSQVDTLQRKQRIYELLCEHQLSVSSDPRSQKTTPSRTVSPLFVELLMQASDDMQLESLVAEQAELLSEASSQQVRSSLPFSRDQTLVFASQPVAYASAQDFAETLKSSRN